MKKNTLRRILALVLAIAMFGSDLALVTSANDSIYCGIEDHDHTDDCYIKPEMETVPATEPAATEIAPATEPAATETTPATEAPSEPVCTCGTEDDDHSTECALYVPTFFEQLLAMQTLKELHDAMMANPEEVYALTAEELTALKENAQSLFSAIEEPTEADREYLELIVDTLDFLVEEEAPLVELLDETVTIVRNGSRLLLNGAESCQWQRLGTNGEYEDINDATGSYYDLTAADSKATLRVRIGEKTYSETIVISGDVVVFDIAKGAVSLGTSYSGKAADGTSASGTHAAGNIYIVQQSDRDTMTTHNITFSGNHPNAPFDVTLAGVNMGATPTNHNQDPGSGGSETPSAGKISIPAGASEKKEVTLYLQGENAVRNITYYNGGDTNTPATVSSSLKITDINGDGAVTGSLYVPKKLEASEIDTFVASKTNYNHWNAGIGGTDGSSLVQNLHIAGGKIQVVTTLGDNCTAIGAGGNSYCQMTISGGEVIAHCNGTGAAIGGGIGWNAAAGKADILISGGTVYAENHAKITAAKNGVNHTVGGVAIGSGSTFHSTGSDGTVRITGGTVEAYGAYGNGIGGGNSSTYAGGGATITISGGNVTANSIGGGNSANGDGGSATIQIENQASVTLTKTGTNCDSCGIGGGNSLSGNGGAATITVNGGTVRSDGGIGGGAGGGTGDGGDATVKVSGGTLVAQSIGGGTGSVGGDGGAAKIEISGGIIETGSIGGGSTLNTTDGKLGYATADITGGDISGQFLLMAGGTEPCYFNMSGGILHGVEAAEEKYTMKDGAAVYMDDPSGTVTISGGVIQDCSAANGGAVYMTAGSFTMSGDAVITGCSATENGGAVYLGGGTVTMSGGTIENCEAEENGGAVYLAGGALTMTGGSFAENVATEKGGGAYISGGDFNLNGENATITGNQAVDGAGIYLTGGQPNLYEGSMIGNIASGDGGGIYINRRLVNLKPTGLVTITDNNANRGAGIFIGGTNGEDACFSVDSADGGTVNLSSNTAKAEGGAVCISNGYFTLGANNITLQDNQAASGGAVAVLSGNFTMSDGAIGADGHGNRADNGGAVYVGGGNAYISGGAIHYNQAQQNGGGIAVSDGDIIVSGGNVSNNRAVNGSGGGMYVTSASDAVAVKVYSGHIEGNSALGSGGAVAVQGNQNSTINVQIGVNQVHPGSAFEHSEPEGTYNHGYCPQIKNNISNASGGAFYITGGSNTSLKMFCLVDGGNSASGDQDINSIPLSDFLMVNGGKVVITTASEENSSCSCGGVDCDYHNNENMGNARISGSVHVTGGTLDLYGNMDNPSFEMPITVDLTKIEDHYYDHRENRESVKLVYHENFDYNGVVDSTYTAFDLVVGDTATISDSFYKHEGYQIYGWNTNKDATPSTLTGWYDNGTKYMFVKDEADEANHPLGDAQKYQHGDLTLYAIWEPNGYSVRFDPNVPEGESYTGAEMKDQSFTYNVEDSLKTNTYGRVGYIFDSWTYVDDNHETKTLTDGQRVMNLTAVRGGTVVLKANWKKCKHPSGKIQYTVSQESDQKSVLIKTCTDCQYEATATLAASHAVYDGTSYPARVTCSNTDWFPVADSDIQYTGTKIGQTGSVDEPEKTTNAGNYTATINAPDNTVAAVVTFTIEKAAQPAPTVKPTYTEPTKGNNILRVHPLSPESKNISSTSSLPVEFIARYYQDGVEQDTGWHKVAQQNGSYADTQIVLIEELKYYFVYARYAGNDNYLPSSEIMADGTFLFEGNINLKFVVDAGISFYPTETTGQLQINVLVDDEHYLVDGNPKITKENDSTNLLIITEGTDWSFVIKRNPDVVNTELVEITIKIGTTRDKPTINSAVQEKQIFDAVVNDPDPQISRDSAFTVLYTVKNYDSATYQEPVLRFSAPVPAGTTVIMQNKSAAKITYWSYTAESQISNIQMDDFVRMGSAEEFSVVDGDLKLQFIVDFSQTVAGISGEELFTTLNIAKKARQDGNTDEGAPELASDTKATVKVNLSRATHDLQYKEGVGLTHTFTYSYAAGDAASKWDYRELALIVKIEDLPADAVISAQVNGVWRTIRPWASGQYIVPLGTDRTGTVNITLKSDMIPATGGTYAAVCQLYAAQSVADAAPLNGMVLETEECAFTRADQNVAVFIKEDSDRHLFTADESITVTVRSVLFDGYNLELQLQQQDSDGTYVNKGRRSENIGADQYQFALNDLVPDSYRIVAIVERDDGYVVLEAPYYFVIQ